MGYYGDYPSKKHLICELIQPTEKRLFIKKAIKGNLLWALWQRVESGDYFIKLDIIHFIRGNPGYYVYKPLGEGDHPYYYSCPLSFLKIAKPVNLEWREKVLACHKEKK